jgi:DNA-binding transcriptional LysR family regulator
MQLEALKIFCDVVRLRSFSRGAEANDVIQSAASQTVHSLERRLGVLLIDRSRRPLEVTPQGKLFYDGCRQVLQQYTDLENTVRRVQDEADATVRVAAIYSIGLGDMSQCIQSFTEQHPRLRVQIEYLHPDQVFERVLADEVDFGIVSFPARRRDLVVLPWRREPMVLACPREHPLAHFSSIPPRDLAGTKFVAFDKGLGIRKEVDRFLKRQGATVEIALEFDNVEAIKRAVEVGAGVSLLPQPTLTRELRTGTLASVALTGSEFVRPLGIIHRRGKHFSPNTQQFLELLQSKGQPPE